MTEVSPANGEGLTGQPLPTLALDSWIGAAGLEDFSGKVLVIDFWATWCHPCLAAIPRLNQLARDYADKGVVILGICATTGSEGMAEVVRDRGMDYPVARDIDKQSERALGVRYFPCHVLIDRKGIIRGVGLNSQMLQETLDQVLAEQPA